MRLVEFYALNESKADHYTLEPGVNGQGELLEWDHTPYYGDDDIPDDHSYSVIATGDIEKLIQVLVQHFPMAAKLEDQIRQTYAQCVQDGGEAVYVDRQGVDVQLKTRKDDFRDRDADYTDPSDDNSNSYF